MGGGSGISWGWEYKKEAGVGFEVRRFNSRAIQGRGFDCGSGRDEKGAAGLGFALGSGHLDLAGVEAAGLGCRCCPGLLFKSQEGKKSVW